MLTTRLNAKKKSKNERMSLLEKICITSKKKKEQLF